MSQVKHFTVVAVALAMVLAAPMVSAADASQDALKAQAKVSESDARAAVLAEIPGGSVQSSELEKEHGQWIWSFDVSDPRSPNVPEIQVDARTGRIVSTKYENLATRTEEAKTDKD